MTLDTPYLDLLPEPLTADEANAPDLVFIAFGANLDGPFGSPTASVEHAMEVLDKRTAGLIRASVCYGSPAFPPGSGPDYVNAVAAYREADLDRILAASRALEDEFRRAEQRALGRWMPRAIDIDIIAHGAVIAPDPARHADLRALPQIERTQTEEGIILPHPSMHERPFVLKPMASFAPEWRHPALGRTVWEMASACDPADLAAVHPVTALPRA